MSELVDPNNVAIGSPYNRDGSDVLAPIAGAPGNLFDRLKRSCAYTNTTRNQAFCVSTNGADTREFVKAMCASVLGSAVILMQ